MNVKGKHKLLHHVHFLHLPSIYIWRKNRKIGINSLFSLLLFLIGSVGACARVPVCVSVCLCVSSAKIVQKIMILNRWTNKVIAFRFQSLSHLFNFKSTFIFLYFDFVPVALHNVVRKFFFIFLIESRSCLILT